MMTALTCFAHRAVPSFYVVAFVFGVYSANATDMGCAAINLVLTSWGRGLYTRFSVASVHLVMEEDPPRGLFSGDLCTTTAADSAMVFLPRYSLASSYPSSIVYSYTSQASVPKLFGTRKPSSDLPENINKREDVTLEASAWKGWANGDALVWILICNWDSQPSSPNSVHPKSPSQTPQSGLKLDADEPRLPKGSQLCLHIRILGAWLPLGVPLV